MDEITLYQLFMRAVRSYPDPSFLGGEPTGVQPNSFVVLSHPNFLDTDNFGLTSQHLSRGLAYLRKGGEPIVIETPVVMLSRYDGAYNAGNNIHRITFELVVRDKAPDFHGSYTPQGGYAANRTYEEVLRDCEKIAFAVLQELSQNYIKAQTTKGATVSEVWDSAQFLGQQKTDGIIDDYLELERLDSYLLLDSVTTAVVIDKRLDSRTAHNNNMPNWVNFLVQFSASLSNCEARDFKYNPNYEPIINCCDGSN